MAQIENNLVSKLVPAIMAVERYPDKVDFKLIYACKKHKASLVKHAEDYDEVRLKALKEEYSEKDEKGEPVMIPKLVNSMEATNEAGETIKEYKIADDKKEAWETFYKDLGKQLVDVPDYKISADELTEKYIPARLPYFTELLDYLLKD